MEPIGIIGQGFVGSAVREGMKSFFDIVAFDKDVTKCINATSIDDLVFKVDVTFLCVPTPMRKNGSCDLSIVKSVLEELSTEAVKLGKKDFTVVIKSTIPPGTTDLLSSMYPELCVIFNPEFLTEANAINDYKNQNRIILGGNRIGTTKLKRIFVKAFPEVPVIKTSSTIAETIKYVTNTFLAMKVSYANEIYQMCQKLDIDYDKVIEYAIYDDRLGDSHWSVPGPDGDLGFGGHCFPKDIAALQYLGSNLGVTTTMLDATIAKNAEVRTDKDWEKQIGRAVSAE